MSLYPLAARAQFPINGNFAEFGSSVASGSLGDSNSGTYIEAAVPNLALYNTWLAFNNITVPATEFAYAARASLFGYSGGNQFQCIPSIRTQQSPFKQLILPGAVAAPFSSSQFYTGVATKAAPWAASDVSNLGVYLRAQSTDNRTPGATHQSGISNAVMSLYTASVPVAPAGVTPTGSVSSTTRPTIGWTHVDRITVSPSFAARSGTLVTITATNAFVAGQTVYVSTSLASVNGTFTIVAAFGGQFAYNTVASGTIASAAVTGTAWIGDDKPQTAYQVAVFTAAQVTAAGGGFDPGVTGATYRSGTIAAADASLVLPQDLANGSYAVYVRTQVTASNQTAWSAWGTASWTQAVTPPAAPSLTCTWDQTNQRTVITAVGAGNMLDPNTSTFEGGVGLWSALTNCSIAVSGTFAASGAQSLLITPTGAGTCVAVTPLGGYPVVVGQQYTASSLWRAGVNARTVRMDIQWFNASNTLLNTSTGSGATDATGVFTTLSTVTGTAPAGAVSAVLLLYVVSASGASDVHYVDQIMFAPGTSTAWTTPTATTLEMLVLRSVDQVTWKQVRPAVTDPVGAVGITVPASSQQYAVYDYEATRGQTVYYQVMEYVFTPSAVSSATGSANVATVSDGRYWLKACTSPALNVGPTLASVDTGSTDRSIDEAEGVFYPMGRKTAVVVAGDLHGIDGGLTISTTTTAGYDAVLALMKFQGVLLLQEPWVSSAGVAFQRYVRLTSRGAHRNANQHQWAVTYVETDAGY